MSNGTTQHIPADVRERVAREVFALASDWRREYWDQFRRDFPRQAQAYYDTADRILALLRTPRGEEEDSRLAQVVRAILERIDRYQAFHDRVGPADLTLPPVARTITEEEIFALRAALLRTPRGEGEAWRAFLDALDEYEAAANLWADPEGPTAADMERLRQSRQRVIECALALAAIRSEVPGDGPVGAVCANCGAPNAAIAGGELDPDEAVCSVECYEQLRELGCPQEHGGTYRPKPARRGEGGSNGLE